MSDGQEKNALEKRISRLEQRVNDLEYRLREEHPGDDKPAREKSRYQPPGQGEEMEWGDSFPGVEAGDRGVIGENWLNRIGLVLLLFGVALLFKYSVDQGWLIPPVRSAIGLAIGLALFIPGLQLGDDRSPMKEILLGGGIAAFYITGFATFQLYYFAPAVVVWAFMIVVTLLALSLSLQYNQAVLSVTGVLGGLSTPFMLYSGSGSLTGLMIYTSLILAGGALIYMKKGWKSLLWTMAAGGMLIFLVGLTANILEVDKPLLSDRWALQFGTLAGALAFWVLPVVREVLSRRNPQEWPDPMFLDEMDSGGRDNIIYIPNTHVNIISLVVPFILFPFSMGLWEIPDRVWGGLALVVSLPLGYAYFPLMKEQLPKLASVHAFSALALLTFSLALLFEGNQLLTAFALEAAGLRYIALKSDEQIASFVSHLVFGIIALWVGGAMVEAGLEGRVPFTVDAFLRLGIILLAGFLIPLWLRKKRVQFIYRMAAHLALLGWFYNTFVSFTEGQAIVTAFWGIYSIALLAAGFKWNKKWLRGTGMATIFLVIGKLFIVDLSQLQAIWRILLFIGFGALLLVIGYFVQFKWNGDGRQETGDGRPEGN